MCYDRAPVNTSLTDESRGGDLQSTQLASFGVSSRNSLAVGALSAGKSWKEDGWAAMHHAYLGSVQEVESDIVNKP
jgi:hypothetical protein